MKKKHRRREREGHEEEEGAAEDMERVSEREREEVLHSNGRRVDEPFHSSKLAVI